MDADRFHGTGYRAANWICPGRTAGARSHGSGEPQTWSNHQRHLCLSAGQRCSAAFMRRSHPAGNVAMKTLVTNELFPDFIECRYRGFLKITDATGRPIEEALPGHQHFELVGSCRTRIQHQSVGNLQTMAGAGSQRQKSREGNPGCLLEILKFSDLGIDEGSKDEEREEESRRSVLARGYWVFNADQVDGLMDSPRPSCRPFLTSKGFRRLRISF